MSAKALPAFSNADRTIDKTMEYQIMMDIVPPMMLSNNTHRDRFKRMVLGSGLTTFNLWRISLVYQAGLW